MKEPTREAAGFLPAATYEEFSSMSRGIFELHAAKLAAAVTAFVNSDDAS